MPYPPESVRSVTLLYDAGRLSADVTAEVSVAAYPPGAEPVPARVAGVDLGIIHPYAVAAPPNPGSAGRGAGGATSGSWRPGTGAGSARPSTRPPAP